MRYRAAFLFAALLFLFGAREARADETGILLGTNLMLFQPILAGTHFTGSGVPYGGDGSTQNFDHSGRQFGVHAPAFVGAELRLGVVQRHFEIGGQFFGATSMGDSGGASDPSATELAKASSMSAYGGGLHAVLSIPAGLVTFAIGPDFGVRGFQVPLTGFEPTVCSNKYGQYSCPQTATATQPYFQPRITVIVHADPKKAAGFYVGPWAGVDVIPSPSWAAGLSFGWGYDQNALR